MYLFFLTDVGFHVSGSSDVQYVVVQIHYHPIFVVHFQAVI
jgi:hypothetical protein